MLLLCFSRLNSTCWFKKRDFIGKRSCLFCSEPHLYYVLQQQMFSEMMERARQAPGSGPKLLGVYNNLRTVQERPVPSSTEQLDDWTVGLKETRMKFSQKCSQGIINVLLTTLQTAFLTVYVALLQQHETASCTQLWASHTFSTKRKSSTLELWALILAIVCNLLYTVQYIVCHR